MISKNLPTQTDISGAKLVLDTISEHGITYIFAVPGREAEGILFNESPDLQIVLTAVEFTAGFAAYAHSIISGTTQVVFSTLGPGAANLANAIYSAYADRVAIVFITAQVERQKCYYNDTHQCIDAVKMYDSVTKFAYEIIDAEEIKDVITKAFKVTQIEPKGPAVISIPIDVLKEKIPYKESPIVVMSEKTITPNSSTYSIDEVVSTLENAKQPLLYVGHEVIRSDSVDLIRRLCETYNIPLVSAYDAKGVLPTDHELNYFACTSYAEGILGINADEVIFGPVDCVVAFGYDWKDDVFADKHFSYGIEKTLINFSGNMPNEVRPQFAQHIQGDLKGNLTHLLDKLAERGMSAKKLYDITPVREAISRKIATIEAPQGTVNIISVVNAINDNSAVLVSDVGTFRHYAVLFGKTAAPNFFLTSAGSSSFGTGLPLGLGACLAYSSPKTKVVVLAGDGGFNSAIGDLRTCKNLNLDMVVIVLNNHKNGLINIYQEKGHGQTYSPAVAHAKASFVTIAEGYGCKAFKVSSVEELKNRLEPAFEIDGPVVIEVPVYYPQEDIERLTHCTTLG